MAIELPKGQALILDPQWKELWREEDLPKVEELETEGILIPFQILDPVVKVYSLGMKEFVETILEKDISIEDIKNYDIVSGLSMEQTPIIDKTALRRFLLSRDGQTQTQGQDSITEPLPVGEVLETPIGENPVAEVAEEDVAEVEQATTTTENTPVIRTRSNEPSLCEILGLNMEVFGDILKQMKTNFVFNGVQYGKLSCKAKGNLMATGRLPRFKNFRVATEEELNLFLLLQSGEYELPGNLMELILERTASRSKRTTGKWKDKQGETVNTTQEVVPETENAPEIAEAETVPEVTDLPFVETAETEDAPVETQVQEDVMVVSEELRENVLDKIRACTDNSVLQQIMSMLE